MDFCEQMNGSCADFREYARSLDTMILEKFYRTETSFFPSLWPILSYTTTDAFLQYQYEKYVDVFLICECICSF